MIRNKRIAYHATLQSLLTGYCISFLAFWAKTWYYKAVLRITHAKVAINLIVFDAKIALQILLSNFCTIVIVVVISQSIKKVRYLVYVESTT